MSEDSTDNSEDSTDNSETETEESQIDSEESVSEFGDDIDIDMDNSSQRVLRSHKNKNNTHESTTIKTIKTRKIDEKSSRKGKEKRKSQNKHTNKSTKKTIKSQNKHTNKSTKKTNKSTKIKKTKSKSLTGGPLLMDARSKNTRNPQDGHVPRQRRSAEWKIAVKKAFDLIYKCWKSYRNSQIEVCYLFLNTLILQYNSILITVCCYSV